MSFGFGWRELEERADQGLGPWATKYSEAQRDDESDDHEETYRTRFRRDRDRILYTTAFRRLQHKTQVIVTSESDHYRTRLTHTLEVEQLASSLAQTLQLNRDLCSAIAFGHDLGHTPFGHAGEQALDTLVETVNGGFAHTIQSVRNVEFLIDHRGRRGLNLCRQVREGILKHDSGAGEKARKHSSQWNCEHLNPEFPGSLEMQAVYWADKIAYVTHDWDDFVRSGLKDEALKEGALSKELLEGILGILLEDTRLRLDAEPQTRDLIRNIHAKLARQTYENLQAYNVRDSDAARRITQQRMHEKGSNVAGLLVNMPDDYRNAFMELRKILKQCYLNSPLVSRMDDNASFIISALWNRYKNNKQLLSWSVQKRLKDEGVRPIADHIAGMTDRYAMRMYEELYTPKRHL